MHDPMLWNKLDEAAAWLTEATDTKWSVKQVLDAALTQNSRRILGYLDKKIPLRKHLRMTCLEAVMPYKAQFGYYKTDDVMTMLDNPEGLVRTSSSRYERVELTGMDVRQLLLYGQVQVRIARYPNAKFGMDKICVLIEPVDKAHIVTLDMVGISRDELKMLAVEFLNSKSAYPDRSSTKKTNVSNNTKKWTDEQLKSLWEESLLPGSTHEILGKKYEVSRQWIGKQLSLAKHKFSKMGNHRKTPATLDALIHKMKK